MSSKPEIRIIRLGDEHYPDGLLASLGNKAPKELHCIGNIALLKKKAVGFCGSRKASDIGLETAADCAEQAAKKNVVVVSGNAAGIDFQAHLSALMHNGETILVLPEGIDSFSIRVPFRQYWDWSRVLVVSQFEPSAPWRAYHAMARNKVILGLSSTMIVIEAGSTGGTLDAGKSTLAAGLPLFVANYEQDRAGNAGNELLIRSGGIPLNRLRSTNRANMEKVWAAFTDTNLSRMQPKLI